MTEEKINPQSEEINPNAEGGHTVMYGICENKCFVPVSPKTDTDAVKDRVGTLETEMDAVQAKDTEQDGRLTAVENKNIEQDTTIANKEIVDLELTFENSNLSVGLVKNNSEKITKDVTIPGSRIYFINGSFSISSSQITDWQEDNNTSINTISRTQANLLMQIGDDLCVVNSGIFNYELTDEAGWTSKTFYTTWGSVYNTDSFKNNFKSLPNGKYIVSLLGGVRNWAGSAWSITNSATVTVNDGVVTVSSSSTKIYTNNKSLTMYIRSIRKSS